MRWRAQETLTLDFRRLNAECSLEGKLHADAAVRNFPPETLMATPLRGRDV
ncbi:hypothetical protein GCM10010389_27710 [Streptomyces echinoruber]|uniref:Uncharacterized protein n=1 Tax=Streptomyces echinoruber TaxID=68898 RepID=A0A918R7D4_9ACTN|nr:hypothetical protein GCM10010389_27710 [Streptomyces echinoruber]